MRKDVMEVCTNACEKHTANNEMVRKLLKSETLYQIFKLLRVENVVLLRFLGA